MEKHTDADAAVRAALRARQVEAETANKLAIIDAYGQDTYPHGAVFTFVKHYDANVAAGLPAGDYTYAALKADNGWYLTGARAGNRHSWHDLLVFLVSGHPVTPDNFIRMVPTLDPSS